MALKQAHPGATQTLPLLLLLLLPLLLVTADDELDNGLARRCPQARHLEVDQCAAQLGFLGDHSFRLPDNDTAAEEHCRGQTRSIGCLGSYARDCLRGFTKQLMASLLARGRKQHALICADQEARRRFRSQVACLAGDRIQPVHASMEASIARFEHIASGQLRAAQRLPALCCAYALFNRDLEAAVAPSCGPQALSYLQRLVSGTAGEFFGLICAQHRTLADCRASGRTGRLLGPLEQQGERVLRNQTRPRNRSPVLPLLDILEHSAPL